MPKFEVVSEYQPAGDQPEAIAALSRGLEMGLDEQTLLGVTGSGKTFTMAKIIEQAPCHPGGGAVPADAGGPPCRDPVRPAGAHRHVLIFTHFDILRYSTNF